MAIVKKLFFVIRIFTGRAALLALPIGRANGRAGRDCVRALAAHPPDFNK